MLIVVTLAHMLCGAPVDRQANCRDAAAFDNGNGLFVHIPQRVCKCLLSAQILPCLRDAASMRLEDVRAQLLVPWVLWIFSEYTALTMMAAVPGATGKCAGDGTQSASAGHFEPTLLRIRWIRGHCRVCA